MWCSGNPASTFFPTRGPPTQRVLSMTATDFVSVTEIAGDDVTVEQVQRLARRYHWAADYCVDKDVLEVACGSAPGVGYLGTVARSVTAGDVSDTLLELARGHYGRRFEFCRFDAQQMPFPARSFDIVILFEALYYIPDAVRFFNECRRVLRIGGTLLLSTANKDMSDFNASPYSHRYLGVVELASELSSLGFAVTCFGDTPVTTVAVRQRLLRPIKAVGAHLGLIPKSMRGKKLLKRLVFGRLVPMPAEIATATAPRVSATRLEAGVPDRKHKVIFCAAVLTT